MNRERCWSCGSTDIVPGEFRRLSDTGYTSCVICNECGAVAADTNDTGVRDIRQILSDLGMPDLNMDVFKQQYARFKQNLPVVQDTKMAEILANIPADFDSPLLRKDCQLTVTKLGTEASILKIILLRHEGLHKRLFAGEFATTNPSVYTSEKRELQNTLDKLYGCVDSIVTACGAAESTLCDLVIAEKTADLFTSLRTDAVRLALNLRQAFVFTADKRTFEEAWFVRDMCIEAQGQAVSKAFDAALKEKSRQ